MKTKGDEILEDLTTKEKKNLRLKTKIKN